MRHSIVIIATLLVWALAQQDAITSPGDVPPALHVQLLNGTVIDTSTWPRPLLIAVYRYRDLFSR